MSGWLLIFLILLCVSMVVKGAATLREAGFSITEWKPIDGLILPAGDEEYQKEFDIYKNLPQFQKVMPHMELDDFKTIYLLEYTRYILEYVLIILAFLPLFIFTVMQAINWRSIIKLLLVLGCGGLQYELHSYLAANSLIDDQHFLPYRLSLELALQFVFFGLVFWQVMTFSYPREGLGGFELPKPPAVLKVFSCLTLVAIFVQIVLGGAVSGLHAGMIFNTFPQMDLAWVPDGLWPQAEWYKNLFEDATTAQFVHRIISYGLTPFLLLFWLVGRNNPHVGHLLPILFSIFIVQFLLGVLALLFAVPVPISSLHYANAILVFSIAVAIMHRLFIPIKTIYYDVGTIA